MCATQCCIAHTLNHTYAQLASPLHHLTVYSGMELVHQVACASRAVFLPAEAAAGVLQAQDAADALRGTRVDPLPTRAQHQRIRDRQSIGEV